MYFSEKPYQTEKPWIGGSEMLAKEHLECVVSSQSVVKSVCACLCDHDISFP